MPATDLAADRAEACVIACAEAFRGDGEILAAPIGLIPTIAVRLARHTFEPLLLVTDGEAHIVEGTWPVGTPAPGTVESWLPYRAVFDIVWRGDRHVMMTPSQIDAHGNANISAIGSHARPKAQLLGVRGAPGNSVSHPTSYWVPRHSARVFTPRVDMVAGVGWDNGAKAGAAATRYMQLRRVVSNLATFDWEPGTRQMRLLSVHAGVSVDEVVAATGFGLVIGDHVPTTREPSAEELRLIREVIDPKGLRYQEVPA
ncbi:CoA-transferase [Trebonia kvetii]|uniref:CoA-transferase n=1 Tax=Trebonia kvetii TaxID=2480626 RepID=A0A6P2BSX8_9ACTN|nr:CoA-transferase [Trebonia kvetii]TVZ02134.1 CoA-transferase [Trebonia kvetii]